MDEVYPPASSFAVGQEPVVLLGHSLGGSIVEARLTVHEGFLAPNSWHVQVLLARKKDAAAKVQGAILLCPVPVMSFCAPAADQTRQTLRKPPGREFTRYLVPSEVQTQSQCSFVQDSQDCTTCCRGTYICFFLHLLATFFVGVLMVLRRFNNIAYWFDWIPNQS